MKQGLEKFVLFLHRRYGITPDFLTYIRVFAAPWLALLISKILSSKSETLLVIFLILYALVIITDLLDGILARAISKEEAHDHSQGGMLDRISDKILIIFMLIPFGLNLFTFLIILGESLLAFQAIHSEGHKKQAGRAGKVKMIFQAFFIPILVLQSVTSFAPDIVVYIYIIFTIILTYNSLYSHYFSSKNG